MGYLRLLGVGICALQITLAKACVVWDPSCQTWANFHENTKKCDLTNGAIATITYPVANEMECKAMSLLMYTLISRLDLVKEASMPWSTISNMLDVKSCVIPSYWLPEGYEGDGCFAHPSTVNADGVSSENPVFAALKNAPTNEAMLAIFDWGCKNKEVVNTALAGITAVGIMGAEQLGTAWSGMTSGKQMAHDDVGCTPNIEDGSFIPEIVAIYGTGNGNMRAADGSWTLEGKTITPLDLSFIASPAPTTSPTPAPTTAAPTTGAPTPAPTTAAPTEAPTATAIDAGHVTKSNAIVTLAVATVLALLAL